MSSRSSRASARTGAAWGSIKALSSFDNTVLAEPCSPATASSGWGPPDRSVANSQATTRTKSFRCGRLSNEPSASIDPPRTGQRQRQHAGRPAEAHRGRSDHLPAVRPDLDRTPARIGEVEIDAAGMLGEADMDRPLGSIELGAGLEQIER